MKANMKIREKARNSGVRLWQIADALGMQESLFSKKLRKELPEDEQERILNIIDDLAKGAS
jgi:hypothetical protein